MRQRWTKGTLISGKLHTALEKAQKHYPLTDPEASSVPCSAACWSPPSSAASEVLLPPDPSLGEEAELLHSKPPGIPRNTVADRDCSSSSWSWWCGAPACRKGGHRKHSSVGTSSVQGMASPRLIRATTKKMHHSTPIWTNDAFKTPHWLTKPAAALDRHVPCPAPWDVTSAVDAQTGCRLPGVPLERVSSNTWQEQRGAQRQNETGRRGVWEGGGVLRMMIVGPPFGSDSGQSNGPL